MNQHASTDSSVSRPAGADAISRRAYELWEKEGRPDGSDLRHWLQAEREMAENRSDAGARAESIARPAANDAAARSAATDSRPLQGTRAAGAAGREPKRGSASPFGSTKSNASVTPTNEAARRKAPGAPLM